MSKITRATLKSFINKNRSKLYIKYESSFDGMVDCIMPVENSHFKPIQTTSHDDKQYEHTLGIKGLWLVGESRDYFQTYEDDNYKGYEISNCCGSCIVAIEKESEVTL